MTMRRREFFRAAAVSAAAFRTLNVIGAESPAKKYKTALIGCGWWGNNILREAMAAGASKIVGLCDVDRRALASTLEKVKKDSGDEPKTYADYRDLLAKESPEIVIVGTPDHWHALPTIAAVGAGAHVYVEKPVGHTIGEGVAMVKAARAANRVVQVGTHRRISPHNVSAREFVQAGKLGKIGMVRTFVLYGGGGPEKPRKNVEPPPEVDWDFWCGPAPLRPYNGNPDNPWGGGIHPRGFRQYLDYANGTLGDWGVHWLDQVLWITGEKWPRKVFSTGGRPIKGVPVLSKEEQTSDAPDHQVATYEFDSMTVTWEHRQFAGNNAEKGENVGCYFYGTEGTLHVGWQKGWVFHPSDSKKPEITGTPQLNMPDQQNIRELWADFLGAIREGRRPVCDIEEIHRSTNMSLLGMLSMKLGRSIAWDGARDQILNDPDANKLLRREYRGSWKYPEA